MGVLLLNCKDDPAFFGEKGIRAARISADVAYSTKADIIVAPHPFQLARIASATPTAKLFSQTIDYRKKGTGALTLDSIAAAGAVGALINHSEDRSHFDRSDVNELVLALRSNRMQSCVCVSSPRAAVLAAQSGADYIGIEDPVLIGMQRSITDSNPQLIANSIEAAKTATTHHGKILVGVGVRIAEHVRDALRIGADGVMVHDALSDERILYERMRELARPLGE